jgi:hypothetical protein
MEPLPRKSSRKRREKYLGRLRKGENMNNEELIRQGNLLIAAARDGKTGFNEDELKGLQKNYLRWEKLEGKIQFQKIIGIFIIICGLGILMCGYMGGYDPGWAGILGIIGGAWTFGDMHQLEQRARQYEELVKREYPLLGNGATTSADCTPTSTPNLQGASNSNNHQDRTAPKSSADELSKLHGLLKDGALTQEEFDNEKKKILGKAA